MCFFKSKLNRFGQAEPDSEIVHTLPAEFVKRHGILPLEITNGTIHIATSAPGNLRVIDDIRLLSGLEVEEIQAPAAEIAAKIAECYQVTVEKMVGNFDSAKNEWRGKKSSRHRGDGQRADGGQSRESDHRHRLARACQ
ncbi:MAG: hypothetical protein WDN00_02100 [Limisphaerales bacterium]